VQRAAVIAVVSASKNLAAESTVSSIATGTPSIITSIIPSIITSIIGPLFQWRQHFSH
jgi:hypothetical protein